MKNLKSFKKYQNLYSKTYCITIGDYKNMDMKQYTCRTSRDINNETHHSKEEYAVYALDAYGRYSSVKYIKGLVNAKKAALELYNKDNK